MNNPIARILQTGAAQIQFLHCRLAVQDCRVLQHGLLRGLQMGKRKQNAPVRNTELQAFVEDLSFSRGPTIRIYRLERSLLQTKTRFRKETRLGVVSLSEFSHDPSDILEYLQGKFGVGDYLLRTVNSNGRY